MTTKTRDNQQITGSFLSIPSRVQLRILDSATGSYPTTLRHSSHQKGRGDFPIRFNDTRTPVFSSFRQNAVTHLPGHLTASYPQVMPHGCALLEYPTSSLKVERFISSSLFPTRGRFNSDWSGKNDYAPFDDAQAIALTDTTGTLVEWIDKRFYEKGSAIEGFTQPLKNKLKFTIDLSVSGTKNEIFMSTGSAGLPTVNLPLGSGLAYYNFDMKRWEMHGVTRRILKADDNGAKSYVKKTSGSNVNFVLGIGQNDAAAALAARKRHDTFAYRTGSFQVVSTTRQVSVDQWQIGQSQGRFVGNCGFPFAEKFNATGSQRMSLKGLITHPFLVEKMVYEFTGSFLGQNAASAPITANFCVLREGSMPFSGTVKSTYLAIVQGLGNSDNPLNTHIYTSSFATTRERDIVGFGQLITATADTTFKKGGHGAARENSYISEVNIIKSSGSFYGKTTKTGPGTGGLQITTGSFAMSFTARIPISIDNMGFSHKFSSTTSQAKKNQMALTYTERYVQHNRGGGANNMGNLKSAPFISSGRSAMSVPGAALSGSTTLDRGGAGFLQENVVSSQRLYEDSPYLLFPEDHLVFQWVNQQPNRGGGSSSGWNGHPASNATPLRDNKMHLAAGPARITFYGSVLRNGLPINHELNQNLTSDAAHEIIQEVIVDQYDVEYRTAYRNSYTDRCISGSMNGDIPTQPGGILGNQRQSFGSYVSGSVVATHIVLKKSGILKTPVPGAGAFNKFVRLTCTEERYYDTIMPGIIEYCKRSDGFDKIMRAGGEPAIGGNTPPRAESAVAFLPRNFFLETGNNRMPFPYDGNPTRIDKDTTPIAAFGDLGGNTLLAAVKDQMLVRRNLFTIGKRTDDIFMYNINTSDIGFQRNSKTSINNQGLWNTFINAPHMAVTGSTGFRYGIQNIVPGFTSAVFRRDRYGQLRDMLEQRQDGKFLIDQSPDYGVVQAVFTRMTSSLKVDPAETRSSNLSQEASSSLPFFEDEGRWPTGRNRPSDESSATEVTVTYGTTAG